MTVIQINQTRAAKEAKEKGIALAVGYAAMSANLSEKEARSLMEFARNRYVRDNASPAKAVADARAKIRRHEPLSA